VTLGTLGRSDDEIKVYDEVIARYKDSTETNLMEQVAKALVNKGVTLIDTGTAANKKIANECFKDALKKAPNDELVRQISFSYLGEQSGLYSIIDKSIAAFGGNYEKELFEVMGKRQERMDIFFGNTSIFPQDDKHTYLLVLREWNSYTPAIPDQYETDRGGGYYIRYKNNGIVIDPGYDFIRNFSDAGGRLCDINHVIITHAHNDHTNDFESLLSLFYQLNEDRKKKNPDSIPKLIHLYLSQGAARKFSGYLSLRNVQHIGKVEILNQGCKENPQTINLHGVTGVHLTVLRAYHDDVITEEYSIGLGFEFDINGSSRRIVFTGDTGLFPPSRDKKDGKIEKDGAGNTRLDYGDNFSKMIFNEYPEKFKAPDLIIPHIGSIKKEEFKSAGISGTPVAGKASGLYFYPNHLGFRGTIALIHGLKPKSAIISEFGEELKDIRFSLIREIAKIINKITDEEKVQSRSEEKYQPFITPGDLTIIYDIGEDKFFCHQTCDFEKPSVIDFLEFEEGSDSKHYSSGTKRTYIFNKPLPWDKAVKLTVDRYHTDFKNLGHPCGSAWIKGHPKKSP